MQLSNFINLGFRLSPWNKYCLLVLRFLHGVRRELMTTFQKPLLVPSSLGMSQLPSNSRPVKMGPTAVSETSSVNSLRTPCKHPRTKEQLHKCAFVG